MILGMGIAIGALGFSLVHSLLSTIRESRPKKTAYTVWLDQVAKDNTIHRRRNFSSLA